VGLTGGQMRADLPPLTAMAEAPGSDPRRDENRLDAGNDLRDGVSFNKMPPGGGKSL